DIARRAGEQPRGLLLAAGRNRVDVEIIGIARNVRRDRLRSRKARGRGDRRHDDVGVRHRIRRRARKPRAHLLSGRLELRTLGFREQDVPGGDAFNARLTQAGRDRLAGFAEPDEAEAWFVAWLAAWLVACHGSSKLALNPLVEALDVDHDAGVGPVA